MRVRDLPAVGRALGAAAALAALPEALEDVGRRLNAVERDLDALEARMSEFDVDGRPAEPRARR